MPSSPTEELPVLGGGVLAFASTLAVSTFLQGKLLGVSTGSIRPIPSVLGFASVAVASVASHYATLDLYKVQSRRRSLSQQASMKSGRYDDDFAVATSSGGNFFSWHTLRICALGLLTFKILGGRFWAIAPSSFTHLGSFARVSLPATSNYATPTDRLLVEELGRRWGCHTCGSRMWWSSLAAASHSASRFHADHMPPKAVAEQMNRIWWRKLVGRKVPYRFYPQCIHCSNQQGILLGRAAAKQNMLLPGISASMAGAGGGRQAYFHGLRPRVHHLTGGVLGAVAVVGATPQEILDGSRERYEFMQDVVSEWLAGPRALLSKVVGGIKEYGGWTE